MKSGEKDLLTLMLRSGVLFLLACWRFVRSELSGRSTPVQKPNFTTLFTGSGERAEVGEGILGIYCLSDETKL